MTVIAENAATVRMMRLPELMAVTGLSRAAIYAKSNPKDKARYDADFPRRVQLSANAVAWPSNEVEEWLQGRLNARKQGQRGEQA